ncbi:MAG: lipopolysaccharide biosynthesis protein [Burkholderiaceae bacterium]|nr:lipopolysaccharide biosynthesis protein [Burkholderiaceae bacterium]
MTGVRRALAFSFAERYLSLAINLASNMAIARLLTPAEIGVFSVSLAFIGIAQVLRDFGVASYLIQERDLTDRHVSTAFGVLLVLGVSVFLALFLAAPWIAAAYGEPAMTLTLRICSLNFLLLPFCTVSLALLRRAMAFKRLTLIGFVATAVGAAATVGMAYLDFGVTSLAVGSVLVNAVTGIGALWARQERRILMPGFSEWRKVLNFGAQSSAAGVVTSISMDINDLAVGKLMGFEPVALLSRAQGLMNMFHRDLMAAVRNVAFPAYARAAREQQAMEPLYVTSVTHVTVVAWPFYGFVSLYALDILRLMFGAQWDAAAPLVPVFCLAGAAAATISLIANLILALGRIDLVTKVELFFQPLRAALVVVAALTFKTTMACALALVLAFFLHVPLMYYVKGRCLPNDYRLLWRGLGQSLGVTLLALALPALMAVASARLEGVVPRWAFFAPATVMCVAAWLAALVWLRHPLAQDEVFLRLLKRFRLRRLPH